MRSSDLVIRLIREPAGLLDEAPGPLLPRLAAITVVGAIAFGAAVGAQHSAVQAISSAGKLPLVMLVPPIVAMPALAALAHALGLTLPLPRATTAALVSVARIAVFAAAMGPALWFLDTLADSYRVTVLSSVAALGVCGLIGMGPLLAAPLGDGELRRFVVAAGTVAVFGAVSGQTAWLLRPLVLRPELSFVLFEFPESDVFTEIGRRLVGSVS